MKAIKVGHLTDLHLNGKSDRRNRLLRGLSQARAFGVDHLVLTGDLTKSGRPEQMAELAACLASWHGHEVTIIPGNHDAGDAFDQSMMDGMLARFFGPKSGIVSLGGLRILPLDTRFERRALAFRALGHVGRDQLQAMASAVSDLATPLIVAQHHGPHRGGWGFVHGLTDRLSVLKMIETREDVHVLAGHDHVIQDLHGGKVHVAASVAHHPDPLRVYRFVGRRFEIVHRSPIAGGFWSLGRRVV